MGRRREKLRKLVRAHPLWTAGAVAGVAALAVWAVDAGAVPGFRPAGRVDRWEQDILARMLRVELRGGGSWDERVGEAQVALNRARRKGCSVYDVITGRCPGEQWSGNPPEYNRLLGALSPDANDYRHAELALQGYGWEIVGPREHFVHPYNPTFRTPSAKRPLLDPLTGRYVPLWSISTRSGGRAQYEPQLIGSTPTLFSGVGCGPCEPVGWPQSGDG